MLVEVLYEISVKLVFVSISVTVKMYFLTIPFWCLNGGGCQEIVTLVESTVKIVMLFGVSVGTVQKQL